MRLKIFPSRVWLLATFLLISNIIQAQQKEISGKVTDATTGQPVVGATVSVRGSGVATQTNASGNFTIAVPNSKARLEISSVGFEPQDISPGSRTNIAVSLKT